MAYRNKTYIAFDGTTDIHYYRLMEAWKDNDNCDFNFSNAHDLNTARDSSQEESIKAQLRKRFAISKQLIVLIGEETRYSTPFVKWELEVALRLDLPIIAVNLNKARRADDRCPPPIVGELAIFVPFRQKIIVHAIDTWAGEHAKYRREGRTGAA